MKKIELARKAAEKHADNWRNSGRVVTLEDMDFLTSLHMRSNIADIKSFLNGATR